MPKICYKDKNFKPETMARIDQANDIIEEYQAQGYGLTLRQLYYQFVARGLIENKLRSYQRLSAIISDARLAGLVDWNTIEDRTRNVRRNSHWESPMEIVGSCAAQFQLDKWEGQPHRPEVWIEKEALIGVISGVCRGLDVPYFACKGYTSQSSTWEAAMRLRSYIGQGQTPLVIHLGDHDPSGMDMTRDITDRVSMFVEGQVEVKRIALTMDQVREFNPPPNPAKFTDSRCEGYVKQYGYESWELDALEPKMIGELIKEAVLEVRDNTLWGEKVGEEEDAKSELKLVANNWPEAVEFLS